MASDTTSGNTAAGIMCQTQQDTKDYLKEFDDEYETIITTIPRDGSLTKYEFIKRHEDLANELCNRLIEVANNESKLKTLVSFVNTIFNDIRESEMCSDEHDSETEDDKVFGKDPVKKNANFVLKDSILISSTYSDILLDVDGNDENDACSENEDTLSNLLILRNDIQWLRLPFLAVERNSIEVVEMCFKTGIDLEIFRNWNGQTLLGHSIEQSKLNVDIINVLLKCIDVNIGAKNGITPVMACMQNKDIAVKERFALLERLIDAGADVMTRSFHLRTPLHEFTNSLLTEMNAAKLTEWKSVIDVLLTKGVDINAIDFFRQTALICAITSVPPTGLEDSDAYDLEAKRNIVSVRRCKIEIVEYLLHKGANMEVIGNNGYTALCTALANQNVDVVDNLVKHGANVNHLTNIKMSPAYVICCEGDWSDENDIQTILLPSLRILLNAGLNLNIKGLDDSTVLHFASATLNHTVCEFLVKSGADLQATDYLKRTPLHMAVRNRHNMVIKTLINLGADIEAKDIHGDSPLTHACFHGNTNAVQILIDIGADCKVCGDLGIQPIHIAAEDGDSLMMAILQNAGCDLSTRDASGATPLHYAASHGNPDTVKYLLNQNVSKNCEDSQGLVPLDLALLRGEYSVSIFLANCPSAVKFGRLPPGLFPNRPLRKMHELDDYLEEITEPLKTIGEPGVGIAKAILDTPGLGRLHLDEGESKQIYESIQQLCLEIVERIGELDPLFQCKLMNAGSSFEGVKVAYPNEFDFVCHLENISAFVEKLENVDIPEYCQIIMKDSIPPDISRFCLRSKKSLNAGDVLRHFVRLTRIATYDVLKRPHQHIYSGMLLLDESAIVFGDSPIPYSKLQGFTVSWRGPTYKHIDVSIDINPVLYTTEWPSEAVGSSILLPNIKKEGMYLIPKCCNKYLFSAVVETIPFDTDLWRYSTHHVEAIMMQRLPQKARDCYMLCKAFRLEPLTCSIEVNKTEKWMSETRLHKLCPLDERGYVISYEDDGSCDDYSEDDYDGNDDDGEIQAEEKRNAANDDFRTDSVSSNNVKDDEGHNPDLSEHEFGVLTLRDSSMLTDTDDGIVKVLVGYDSAEDTYELTAEKCIPSYHLKSIFLQEAETILSASGTFSDRHLQTIPYKVYDRLKTAVETQYLTTPFFPGQNMYRQPQDDDNLPASIKLRMSYIDTILRLLRELGFGFEC
ncbi:hypothetical protein ACJMK2_002512 [Sinanodonta woodiana]|uniref:Mab-21-like nucleotidyltransferase domain-containing protein n=1 Tax=Sinanodonta woodiana TaxID=1069815 RepID=A0ABD3XXC4_SINWO